MPTSTLRTPVTPALTLTRTITPAAVAIEIQDDTGAAVYAEEIAVHTARQAEPTDPEQVEPVL